MAFLFMLLAVGVKRTLPLSTNVVRSTLGVRGFSFSLWVSGKGEGQLTKPAEQQQGSSHNSSNNNNSNNNNNTNHNSSNSNGGSNVDVTSSSAVVTAANSNVDSNIGSMIHYKIAVAYLPKDRSESNLFKRKSQHRSPALDSPTGEDNLFVSKQSTEGSIALGVADGVGGWLEAGYDSSAISRELCSALKVNFEADSTLSPKQLLDLAFKDVIQSPKVEIGGTTACLGVLTSDRTFKVANLGDSWCGVFRNFSLIHETGFQVHNFNTPYQLAKIPPQIVRQAELEGRRYIIDKPDMADEFEWKLQKNDLILFATDGVTDNVVPKDIELFLKDQFENDPSCKLETVLTKLVEEVAKVSKDTNFPSAFAQELSRLTGQKYLGGKEDDITIVLIKVD